MNLSTIASRIALAAATVGSIAIAAPASGDVGTLSAPVGKGCGAYATGYNPTIAMLRYWHCGGSVIRVEVDAIYDPNYTVCVAPGADVELTYWTRADNAWYVGLCDHT